MNPSAGIQAITFDVGGTLIEPWPSVGHIYAEVAARHGVKNVSPAKLNHNFTTAWRAKRHFNHTREDWAALVDATFAEIAPEPSSRTFFPALYDRFAESTAWRVFDDARPALEKLRARGVRMAVLSNWDERLRPLLCALGLDDFFETLVVSCEVGFAKPSHVIFDHTSRKLGLPPSAILHVGDSEREDAAGASAAGFRSVLIARGKTSANGTLASLNELFALVDDAD